MHGIQIYTEGEEGTTYRNNLLAWACRILSAEGFNIEMDWFYLLKDPYSDVEIDE